MDSRMATAADAATGWAASTGWAGATLSKPYVDGSGLIPNIAMLRLKMMQLDTDQNGPGLFEQIQAREIIC
jgi:hypothetical protein